MQIRNEKTIWEKDRDHLIHPYTDFSSFQEEGSQIIREAKGMYVTDTTGQKMMDGIAGLWCVNIGHGRQEMADAIAAQVLQMQYYNPFGHTSNEPASELAYWLAQNAPGSLNHAYFTCGGSTANDAAIRLVHFYNAMRGKHKKKKIISRMDAYHGATYVAANLTGISATKINFDRIGEDFIHHVSAANLSAKPAGQTEEEYCDALVTEFETRIQQLGPDNVAAFIAEPIMGAGGVLIAPTGYHKKMHAICKKYDMLYIADEVVTAFGRLGEWFSSEARYGMQPDILVSAKGITSGYIPLGATLISDEIYDVISHPQCEGGVFSMGLTYFGHPVACAAALKNIEIMERENLLGNAKAQERDFQSGLRTLLDNPVVGDVRGDGLMAAVDLMADGEAFPLSAKAGETVFKNCLKRGLVVRPVGDRIVLSPPLIISQREIGELIETLRDALEEFHRSIS